MLPWPSLHHPTAEPSPSPADSALHVGHQGKKLVILVGTKKALGEGRAEAGYRSPIRYTARFMEMIVANFSVVSQCPSDGPGNSGKK